MLARLCSATVRGVEASLVYVEVDVSFGLPAVGLVGLPDSSVRESRDRVRSAIRNSGFDFPEHRITINLAPADVRKHGTAFDLPIAIGVLAASGVISRRELSGLLLIGELSLDGTIQAARAVLPIALAAKRHELELLLPRHNGPEAAVVPDLKVGMISSLAEATQVLNAERTAEVPRRRSFEPEHVTIEDDLCDVAGQDATKRAFEVAAAGGHHLLLVGPPGVGKTMMARRLPGILPPPTFEEAVETTAVHSVLGLVPRRTGMVRHRPFRAPHHTISDVALIGGGSEPRPGEVSLAHNGVLFLDEVPEFSRRTLEVLRQPLEDRAVTIARSSGTATFPAHFTLVAAMNPCPCGYAGSTIRPCRCTPFQVSRYCGKLSGPLRDRLDLIVPMTSTSPVRHTQDAAAESSSVVRRRVTAARARQSRRYKGLPYQTNADLKSRRLAEFCRLDAPQHQLLERAVRRLNLSARAYDRIRRVALTIADLEESEHISSQHLAEAIGYRL